MKTAGHGLHGDQPVAAAGPPIDTAAGVLILLHGRGGDAAGMLDLARALVGPDVACLAPQAAGQVWYPRRFIEPVEANEPDLSSALSVVAGLIAALPTARIGLCGFSQGACLALEYVRRHGGVGAVLGFSGGLIGETSGGPGPSIAGLPVYLGCSERDPHIPLSRVHEAASVLRAMGAAVTTRIAPGGGHEVTRADIAAGRALLDAIYSAG